MFKEKLDEVKSVAMVYQLGKKYPGKTRPMIIRLADFTKKSLVLSKTKCLKGSKIYVNEYFFKVREGTNKQTMGQCAIRQRTKRSSGSTFEDTRLVTSRHCLV